MDVCQALRQALRSGEPVVAPLCYDPLTSKLVEHFGFPAAYLGSGALGFVLNVTEAMMTLTELVTVLRQITMKTSTPIIVDGTTGFGEPLHVMRTVHEVARQLPKEIHKPVVYMLSAVGERPPFTPHELYAMGYPLIIESQGGLMMAYGAMRKAYLELKEKGRISCDPTDIKMIRDEINELVDLPKYWELEARTVEQNRTE